MNEDAELLRRFAREGDESAFRRLVDRHVGFVHTAALRQTNGDAHLAADVTQIVFSDLARKAPALTSHQVLAGWLFTSTRYAAAKLVRTEQRRRAREKEASFMDNSESNPDAAIDWSRVQPWLDEVLASLGAAEREALLLRYFEGCDYQQIGTRLEVGPNTVRMRVERALEKLRQGLERRGVTSTGAALGAALTSQGVFAAPVGLGATVAGTALTALGGSVPAMVFMGMTKLQMGLTAVMLAGGFTGAVVQGRATANWRSERAALMADAGAEATLRAENARLRATAAEVAAGRAEDAEWTRLRDEVAALRLALADADSARSGATSPGAGNADHSAVPRQLLAPIYPEALRRAGVGGEVLVDFIVDRTGAVQNARALETVHPELAQAAVTAAKQWIFDSARLRGRTVNTHVQLPTHFDPVTGETSVGAVPSSPNHPAKWFD